MIAPSTPVSMPNRRGSRNTPDPIIEPIDHRGQRRQADLGVVGFGVGGLGFGVHGPPLKVTAERTGAARSPVTPSRYRLGRTLSGSGYAGMKYLRICSSELGDDLLPLACVLVVRDRAGGTQRLQFLQARSDRRCGRRGRDIRGRRRGRRRGGGRPVVRPAGRRPGEPPPAPVARAAGLERRSIMLFMPMLLALSICRISISGPTCPDRS